MENNLQYQLKTEDGIIDFEVLLPQTDEDVVLLSELQESEIQIDEEFHKIDSLIDEKSQSIDKYTNHADALCYVAAISSGALAGILDIVFVGSFDFDSAKKSVDAAFDNFVHERAKDVKISDEICKYKKKMADKGLPVDKDKIETIKAGIENDFKKNPNKASSIRLLEKHFGLPSDSVWDPKDGITAKSHHLDDLCHHPSVLGLACSILMQFTEKATFSNSLGLKITYSVEKSEFIGEGIKEKIIAGTINWLGHLVSDMAGSSSSAVKGNAGMGLPGPLMTSLKEFSSLPIMRKTPLPKLLNDLFTKDNAIFGKYRLDMRSELAIGKELSKQAIPVFINEILVRSFYFIRGLITYARTAHSIKEIPWDRVIPFGNRTIERMMTISLGTMEVIDMTEAAIQGIVEGGKTGNVYAGIAVFFKTFALRINYVGIGRLVVAGVVDTSMGIKRGKLINERIALYNDKLKLTNAKVLYKEAEMWISAEKAGEAILKSYGMIEATQKFYQESCDELQENLDSIGNQKESIEKKNPGLTGAMLDTLKWG